MTLRSSLDQSLLQPRRDLSFNFGEYTSDYSSVRIYGDFDCDDLNPIPEHFFDLPETSEQRRWRIKRKLERIPSSFLGFEGKAYELNGVYQPAMKCTSEIQYST